MNDPPTCPPKKLKRLTGEIRGRAPTTASESSAPLRSSLSRRTDALAPKAQENTRVRFQLRTPLLHLKHHAASDRQSPVRHANTAAARVGGERFCTSRPLPGNVTGWPENWQRAPL